MRIYETFTLLSFYEELCTAWMKSLTTFSGALHLLHYYGINLAHLLAF